MWLLNSLGCVVGQPAGNGRMSYHSEAKTGQGYYLYLPEDYVRSEGARPADKKWPLVVSFHGMRPWDSAGAQAKEWQQEADRYGYVVVAPDTRFSDMLFGGGLEPHRVSSIIRKDEEGTLAILDEVCQTLDVDPNHVLSTSWSMGGYLAHYMINRHPDRFSCLAVRQSNFSAEILDPHRVPEYHDAKIAIFYTRNDFAICQRESQQAIGWYNQHGFDTTSAIVESLGHERTPQTAAAFFARTCGAVPRTPPAELARIKLTSVPSTAVASAQAPAVAPVRSAEPPVGLAQADRPAERPRSSERDILFGSTSGAAPRATHPAQLMPGRSGPAAQPPDKLPWRAASPAPGEGELQSLNPLSIRLSAHIGISPMLISYTVQMPPQIRKDAEVVWLDNGQPISRGISGQKTLIEPGQHRIEALVSTPDAREYRAGNTVTVLERLSLGEDADDNG